MVLVNCMKDILVPNKAGKQFLGHFVVTAQILVKPCSMNCKHLLPNRYAVDTTTTCVCLACYTMIEKLILTRDGLAHSGITNPNSAIEKEYLMPIADNMASLATAGYIGWVRMCVQGLQWQIIS